MIKFNNIKRSFRLKSGLRKKFLIQVFNLENKSKLSRFQNKLNISFN